MTNNPSISPLSGYHPATRWLHAGLVLGVIFQLACAALMVHPDHMEEKYRASELNRAAPAAEMGQMSHDDDELGKLFMAAHRTGGMVVAFFVLANLLWAVFARGEPRKRQIAVLASTRHWRDAISIAKHLPMMIWGKQALPDPGNALSLVFEMLGLLTMTAMAITGTFIWSSWAGPGNTVSAQVQWLMDIHASIAVMLFFYLTGHVSMAVMHACAGDPVFARILPLSKRTSITQGGNHDVNSRLNSQKHEIDHTRKRS